MKNLFVLNDAPYGSERGYNGLRLAGSLARRAGEDVRVFLMGDAVACSVTGQKVPQGFYNLERMIAAVASQSGPVAACGSCLDARGIQDPLLCQGVHRGSMDELTDWTTWADRVFTF